MDQFGDRTAHLGKSADSAASTGAVHGEQRSRFESKAADVIGLYIGPAQHAAVFYVDEKTAVQALGRLDRVLPLSPRHAERHGFEYFRHGTLSPYAALDIKTGKTHGKTSRRHTSADFLAFLQEIVDTTAARREIHIVPDNLSAPLLLERKFTIAMFGTLLGAPFR